MRMADFPGGPAAGSPPANVRDTGSIPGLGTKIPHASGKVSLCPAAGEANAVRSPRTVNYSSHPLTAEGQLEKALTQQRNPAQSGVK